MMELMSFSSGNTIKRTPVTDLRAENVKNEAMKKYWNAYKKGQIRSEYDDSTWLLITEGKPKTMVNFDTSKEQIETMLSKEEHEKLIDDIKTMVLLRFGRCSQKQLQIMVKYFLEEFAASGYKEGVSTPKDSNHGMPLYYLTDFLDASEWGTEGYREECIKKYNAICDIQAEERSERDENGNACTLNEFESYFRFTSVIKKARTEWMDDVQKLYYFPLVGYWTLTPVLPLRVTEFCLLPYDCLHIKEGRYYITIRRTRLKGTTSKDLPIHYYIINKDYIEEDWEITKWLYDMFAAYQEASKDSYHPYDLLFSIEFLGSLGYRRRFSRNSESVFDSGRMRALLQEFYDDFVLSLAGLTLVTEEDLKDRACNDFNHSYEMFPSEIMMVKLKHTRHLSMINIEKWGANPMTMMAFAGHSSPAMDRHYYDNTTKLIRCATKILWERVGSRGTVHDDILDKDEGRNLNCLIDPDNDPYIEVDDGRCYSRARVHGRFADCERCNGRCKGCRYLEDDGEERNIGQEEKQINEDAAFVRKMFASPKLTAQISETYERFLLLQQKEADLATRLWHQLMDEKKKEVVVEAV